ncbi:MAG: DUF177 domain-containing protein [Vicinamibacterales bacterium]
MLSLNLAKIRTAEEHFEREYQPGALGGGTDAYTIVAPVSLAFDIHKDKDKFHLVGRVKTTLEMPCSRCLEPFTIAVDAPFDLRYQPHTEHHGGGEREVEADDIDTAFYENDEIDLGQLMQEQFYLALPMKPLCKDDCKGLCPNCGTNLNKATCDCNTQWEDPRLAALRALKKDS